MLESTVRRFERHLRRSGLLRLEEDDPDVPDDPESNLAASAVSGQVPPAGPQWLRGLAPLEPQPLAYDKPLCASLDGFTLHAATRAGALDASGREALLRYVLRPPIAQERLEHRPDGLVRILLKKAFSDGTVAVQMDPLSLLCRLATSVPPPRLHTVRYVRVRECSRPGARGDRGSRLSPPSQKRSKTRPPGSGLAGGYRPWAELLARSFAIDVVSCPSCGGRMRLVAVLKEPTRIGRYLAAVGEAAELPRRSPSRGPPHWRSQLLRLKALGYSGSHGSRQGEEA